MDKAVAIVIVTYNGMRWIEECLQSCAGYPTVVVDNNSTDGTVAFIKSQFPFVQIMEEPTNVGFGQANNKGISWALQQGFANVFLLNQDAYIVENSIAILQKIHTENPEYGILSPIHLNGLGTKLDKRFAQHVSYDKNTDFYSDYVLNYPKSPIYEVPFVNAAGWFVSGHCLKNVGGFEPLFFHYGEDDNYCQRVRFHNYKIGVVPGTFIKHDRQDRLLKEPKNLDKTFLDTLERRLKKKYADPNENLNIQDLMSKRKKEGFRAVLKLDWKAFNMKRQEVRMITRLIPKIEASKERVKVKAPHYLSRFSNGK